MSILYLELKNCTEYKVRIPINISYFNVYIPNPFFFHLWHSVVELESC
jgi:hypothetical protein